MKIKVGEQVDLTLLITKQDTFKKKAKGIINEAVEDDYIPRRRQKSVILRFYDVGWRKNESDIYEEISFTPVITIADIDELPPEITSTDYNNLNTEIFETSLEDFLNKFKNVSEFIEEFRLDLINDGYFPAKLKIISDVNTYDIESYAADEDLAGWDENGLRIQSEDANGGSLIIQSRLGNILNQFDLKSNKITATYDYDDDPVELPITGTLEIFLFPRLVRTNAGISHSNNIISPPPLGSYFESNTLDHAIINSFRKMFYDRTDPDFAKKMGEFNYSGSMGDPDPADITEVVNVLINKISGLGNMHVREEANPTPPPLYNRVDETHGAASNFFSLAEPPVPGVFILYGTNYDGSTVFGYHRLCAMIKKDDQWYYVWS